MNRKAFAALLVVVGLIIGFIAQGIFVGQELGANVPILTGLMTLSVFSVARIIRQPFSARNLWPLGPLFFFAVMLAVHNSPTLVFVNGAALVGLGALLLHYFPLEQPLDKASATEYGYAALDAGLYAGLGAIQEAVDGFDWLRGRRAGEMGPLIAVGRGLLIALPVLLVFAVLLGSADAIFGDLIGEIVGLFEFQALDALAQRGFAALAAGWLATGALTYAVARRYSLSVVSGSPTVEALAKEDGSLDDEKVIAVARHLLQRRQYAAAKPLLEAIPENTQAQSWLERIYTIEAERENENPPKKRSSKPFLLGMIEAVIVLFSVDLLFGAFVLVQFAYFFGGQENVGETLTYAEYARRGFFELVAVSVLTLGLVLLLDWVTVRDGKGQMNIFKVLSVVMVALTGVMLLSASQRMLLYESAFGFTHLRVFTHVFMLWLGVLFVFFLLALFRMRVNIFSLGVLLCLIGYTATLNLMNVEYYIADQNIARYQVGEELDLPYLQTLSTDAVPAVFALYQSMNEETNPDLHLCVGQWLNRRAAQLEQEQVTETLFEFNASRQQAWALLEPIRDDLPEGYASNCYRFFRY